MPSSCAVWGPNPFGVAARMSAAPCTRLSCACRIVLALSNRLVSSLASMADRRSRISNKSLDIFSWRKNHTHGIDRKNVIDRMSWTPVDRSSSVFRSSRSGPLVELLLGS